METKQNLFLEKLQQAVDAKELARLTLSSKRDKNSDLQRIIISTVEINKGYCLNFVFRHTTKDITKNLDIREGIDFVNKAMEENFFNADMSTKTENILYQSFTNGKAILKAKPLKVEIPIRLSQNRIKSRLIQPQDNIYLRELGVSNANWEIRREMNDKYLQINKYIEILLPYLTKLKGIENLYIADMGSGKGYLTFALYDYLTNHLKLHAKITGIEYREDLVDACNLIAQKANFKFLTFQQGTIAGSNLESINILIALHACDTATDDAIFRGIQAGVALIVCAPCCHKQIRKSMNTTHKLSAITKYGILKERQSEIITDTLRALFMELHGYKTNVFEFISSEHTPKNVMLIGRKTNDKQLNVKKIKHDIEVIKTAFGIETHYLETLLQCEKE